MSFFFFFSWEDTWQQWLLQRFVCWLVISILLASVTVSAKQSSHRVRLFNLKLFTMPLVIAPGPGVVYNWPHESWKCSSLGPHLPVGFEEGAGLPTPSHINHLQQMGWRGDVPLLHIHDSKTLCWIYALWSRQWEKWCCCFHGKGIINAWIRLTNCTADNLLKEIFIVVSQAGSVGTDRAKLWYVWDVSQLCSFTVAVTICFTVRMRAYGVINRESDAMNDKIYISLCTHTLSSMLTGCYFRKDVVLNKDYFCIHYFFTRFFFSACLVHLLN